MVAGPAYGSGYDDEDSDCPGNSCNAPPTSVTSESNSDSSSWSTSNSRSSATGGNASARGGDGGNANSTAFGGKGGQGGEGGQGGQGGEGGDASSSSGGNTLTGGDSSAAGGNAVGGTAVITHLAPPSPANVYVDGCSAGASVTGPAYGVSYGAGSTFCNKLTLATAFEQAGEFDKAAALRQESLDDLHRQGFVTRFLDWIPLAGRLFR